ncbi:hypothetical protein QQP08_013940 [Theobroma cacao]|nr:hypothetical protein QQP08_013940 [Theobroma cacao]
MWQVSQAFDSPSRGHSDNIACYFLASVGSDSLSLRCYTGQMRSGQALNRGHVLLNVVTPYSPKTFWNCKPGLPDVSPLLVSGTMKENENLSYKIGFMFMFKRNIGIG